jgi:hypothetical protein
LLRGRICLGSAGLALGVVSRDPNSLPRPKRRGLRTPNRLEPLWALKAPRGKTLTPWPIGLTAQLAVSDVPALMIDIRSALLQSGFPASDEIPSGPSDFRAPHLPAGIVGVSVGEREVQLDTPSNRRIQSKAIAALVLGLAPAGAGVVLSALNPADVLLPLALVFPGALILAWGFTTWLVTDFESDAIRVVVRTGHPASETMAGSPGSLHTLEVSGGRAKTENRLVDRSFRGIDAKEELLQSATEVLRRIQTGKALDRQLQ